MAAPTTTATKKSPTPQPSTQDAVAQKQTEHDKLQELVKQFQDLGDQMSGPVQIEPEEMMVNPFDDSAEIDEIALNQKYAFDTTKNYIDDLFTNPNNALRINSLATLGSQMTVQWDVYAPMQVQLDAEQRHFEYVHTQLDNNRQNAQIALKLQQNDAVMEINNLNQKLHLEVQQSQQNMNNQVIMMLRAYNALSQTENQLVLTKQAVDEQQKIVDKRQNETGPGGWQRVWGALTPMLISALVFKGLAGWKLTKGLGKVVAKTSSGLLKKQLAYKSWRFRLGKTLQRLSGSQVGIKRLSKGIGALIGGAIGLGIGLETDIF